MTGGVDASKLGALVVLMRLIRIATWPLRKLGLLPAVQHFVQHLLGRYILAVIPHHKLEDIFQSHFPLKIYDPSTLSRLDKTLKSFLVDSYFYLNEPNRRRLRSCALAVAGTEWAQMYNSREFPDMESRRVQVWGYLHEIISEGLVGHIHQLGASSGREVGWLAKEYPHIQFSSSDINSNIVAQINSNLIHLDNHKSFKADLSEVGDLEALFDNDIDLLLSSASLQYLTPVEIARIFDKEFNQSRYVLLYEPLGLGFEQFSSEESIARGNFSWSHPYFNLAETNGWTIANMDTNYIIRQPWAKGLSMRIERS